MEKCRSGRQSAPATCGLALLQPSGRVACLRLTIDDKPLHSPTPARQPRNRHPVDVFFSQPFRIPHLLCPISALIRHLADCCFRCPAGSIAVSSPSVEHEFTCPYCGEETSMVVDLSVGRQTYIEDCEVCCKPIEISFTVEDDELADFFAKILG